MKLSYQRVKVLREFYESDTPELSGADVRRVTGLGSGSAYPILVVLEERGMLVSRWETEAPADLGRPRRRLYKLTSFGVDAYRQAFSEIAPTRGLPSLRPNEV